MILTVTANPAVDRVYFVDEFEIGEVYRPFDMKVSAGGKGLNVARVAKLLGEDVAAAGFLGGSGGGFIADAVEKLGITDRFTRINGETRTCVNISVGGKSGEILEPGPEVSAAEVEKFIADFALEIERHDALTISGSAPRGVPSDFYVKLIEIANAKGKKVILDTSGDALEAGIAAKPFMVKPNRFELSKLLGAEADVRGGLKALAGMGVALPVVSLGKDGAMAYVEGEFFKFSTPDVPVVNAVGSGDSFVAGVAVGVSRGMSPLDAVKLGMACGTANTQFAQTGMVSQELVNQFFKQIEVEEC